MESIAVQRFDAFMALVAGPNRALGRNDSRADSFEAIYDAHHRDVSRHVILTDRRTLFMVANE